MQAMEFYLRARNNELSVKWSPIKIYHPWHSGTSVGKHEKEFLEKLRTLSLSFPWLHPYAGVKQSWIAYCSDNDYTLKKLTNDKVERFIRRYS